MLTVDFDRLGLKPGERILDMGAGAGRHAFEAYRRGGDVIAFDMDAEELERVRELFVAMKEVGEAPEGAEADVKEGNALSLPFADGEFDRIVSIEMIEAAGDYMVINTGDNSLVLRETMKDLEKRLDPRRFQRVHRSTIVNLDLVKQVKPHTNGECFLLLESGAQVKVSRSYRDVVARFVH